MLALLNATADGQKGATVGELFESPSFVKNNIALFQLTCSAGRKLFSLLCIRLDSAGVLRDKCRQWPLSSDDIFQIQLSLADGNFELFSFSAYFSSSVLFQFYVLLLRMVF